MTNYDFSTLSPLDFEKLVCDLLNAKLKNLNKTKYRFKNFKAGKDQGIDLLLSTKENDKEIIGQVKHYFSSSYSQLKRDLKKEKNKVDELNPKSYVIATSLGLLPQHKIEIKKIFEPYILSLDDIFDRNDLNALLRENSQVEENHFKLWFSSYIVLKKVLNYKFHGRKSEFTDNVLKKKFRLFVITGDFYKAKTVLASNNFIVLTGDPGVGKTTLSEMIIYDLLKDDYELTVIIDTIKEVEETLKNDNSKQLFYFDDFLGHTHAEIEKSKSVDNYLIKIISRIEHSENKVLILNTRRFILSKFLDQSEKFSDFNPLRAEAKIELSKYSYGVKRRMLDNHIAESTLNSAQKNLLNELSNEICNHDSFSPRIVEFFTSTKVSDLSIEELKDFVRTNLENPKEIWKHAYLNQIDDYNRIFINTLFSLRGSNDIERFRKAYDNRLKFEVAKSNFKLPINSFQENLRCLNEGFIDIIDFFGIKSVGFINSSLEDYLKYFIKNNTLEIERILLSSYYIDQWYFLLESFENDPKNVLNDKLKQFFSQNYLQLVQKEKRDEDLYLISILGYLYIDNTKDTFIKEPLSEIKDWEFLNNSYINYYSKKFLKNVKTNSDVNILISNFDEEFYLNSLLEEHSLLNLFDILELFEVKFHLNVNEFLEKTNHEIFYNHLESLFSEHVEENYYFLCSSIIHEDYTYVIEDLDRSLEFIKTKLYDYFSFDYEYIRQKDWQTVVFHNIIEENKKLAKGEEKELEAEFDYWNSYDEYADYYSNDIIEIVDNESNIELDGDLPF